MGNLLITELAAWIAVIIFTGMFFFQFLLAFGTPLGNLAWGGKFRTLPLYLRFSSLVSALIFLTAIISVTERAGILTIINRPELNKIYLWILTGLFGLSTFVNIISGCKFEKRIMTPIAFVSFLLCLLFAAGRL